MTHRISKGTVLNGFSRIDIFNKQVITENILNIAGSSNFLLIPILTLVLWVKANCLDLTMRWSVQHTVAPSMSRVERTSFLSFCPMFWAAVLPGGLQPVLHMEHGVGND